MLALPLALLLLLPLAAARPLRQTTREEVVSRLHANHYGRLDPSAVPSMMPRAPPSSTMGLDLMKRHAARASPSPAFMPRASPSPKDDLTARHEHEDECDDEPEHGAEHKHEHEHHSRGCGHAVSVANFSDVCAPAHVVEPEQAAVFLLNNGTLTSPNGTTYTDAPYCAAAPAVPRSLRRSLLDLFTPTRASTLPRRAAPFLSRSVLKHVRNSGAVLALSPSVGIRMGDLKELSKLLVDDARLDRRETATASDNLAAIQALVDVLPL